MTKVFKSLAICLFFICSLAKAEIVFEPYLGVPLGSADIDGSNNTTSGLALGGRLYYQQLGFFAGTDLKFSGQSSKEPERSYEQNQLGLTGGLALTGLPFRMWVSFFFLDQMSVSQLTRDYSGGGYSLGLSFSPIDIFTINVEYKSSTYDEYETETQKVQLTTDATLNAIFISVGFPFESDLI